MVYNLSSLGTLSIGNGTNHFGKTIVTTGFGIYLFGCRTGLLLATGRTARELSIQTCHPSQTRVANGIQLALDLDCSQIDWSGWRWIPSSRQWFVGSLPRHAGSPIGYCIIIVASLVGLRRCNKIAILFTCSAI